jgi:hypothetical protein
MDKNALLDQMNMSAQRHREDADKSIASAQRYLDAAAHLAEIPEDILLDLLGGDAYQTVFLTGQVAPEPTEQPVVLTTVTDTDGTPVKLGDTVQILKPLWGRNGLITGTVEVLHSEPERALMPFGVRVPGVDAPMALGPAEIRKL